MYVCMYIPRIFVKPEVQKSAVPWPISGSDAHNKAAGDRQAISHFKNSKSLG